MFSTKSVLVFRGALRGGPKKGLERGLLDVDDDEADDNDVSSKPKNNYFGKKHTEQIQNKSYITWTRFSWMN
jgi:hypothetical protein